MNEIRIGLTDAELDCALRRIRPRQTAAELTKIAEERAAWVQVGELESGDYIDLGHRVSCLDGWFTAADLRKTADAMEILAAGRNDGRDDHN